MAVYSDYGNDKKVVLNCVMKNDYNDIKRIIKSVCEEISFDKNLSNSIKVLKKPLGDWEKTVICCPSKEVCDAIKNRFKEEKIYGEPYEYSREYMSEIEEYDEEAAEEFIDKDNIKKDKGEFKVDGETMFAEEGECGMTSADVGAYDSPFEIPTKYSKKQKKMFRRGVLEQRQINETFFPDEEYEYVAVKHNGMYYVTDIENYTNEVDDIDYDDFMEFDKKGFLNWFQNLEHPEYVLFDDGEKRFSTDPSSIVNRLRGKRAKAELDLNSPNGELMYDADSESFSQYKIIATKMSYDEAVEYCKSISTDNEIWRIPTMKEAKEVLWELRVNSKKYGRVFGTWTTKTERQTKYYYNDTLAHCYYKWNDELKRIEEYCTYDKDVKLPFVCVKSINSVKESFRRKSIKESVDDDMFERFYKWFKKKEENNYEQEFTVEDVEEFLESVGLAHNKSYAKALIEMWEDYGLIEYKNLVIRDWQHPNEETVIRRYFFK